MSDNVQSNPPLPLPDNGPGPTPPERYVDVSIRKKEEESGASLLGIVVRLVMMLVGAVVVVPTVTAVVWTFLMDPGSNRGGNATSPVFTIIPSDKDPRRVVRNGSWQAVSMLRDGKTVPNEELTKVTLVITGNKYTFTMPENVHAGSWTCRNDTTPRQVDFFGMNGVAIEAAYEAADDFLRICFSEDGKARPKDFSSKRGSKHTVIIFQMKDE